MQTLRRAEILLRAIRQYQGCNVISYYEVLTPFRAKEGIKISHSLQPFIEHWKSDTSHLIWGSFEKGCLRLERFRLTLIKNHARMEWENKCRHIYRWRWRWKKSTFIGWIVVGAHWLKSGARWLVDAARVKAKNCKSGKQ